MADGRAYRRSDDRVCHNTKKDDGMRYVIYRAESREIQSAITGPEPTEPGPGLRVGDVGDATFEGALQNYVFVPDDVSAIGTVTGRVERKPREEWDTKAEEEESNRQAAMMRFHRLDIAEVQKLEVYLMIPSRFLRLNNGITDYKFPFEGIPLEVGVTRLDPIALDVTFDVGGYTIPFQRTSIRFNLTGHEPFLTAALHERLAKHDEVGRKIFTSMVLKEESLLFALRVANHLIEAYRIAYDDPGERPIGIADVLSGAMVIELNDGLRQVQHSGISIASDILQADRRDQADNDKYAASMAEFLALRSPPFLPVAVSELKKAHLYGQYRECVVWAGTIITNVIEDILLERLPESSPEYKKLKNDSSGVRGAAKRGHYFKSATGRTLREWLEEYEKQSVVWKGLASNVETILNDRNLLLHRKKAIGAKEARVAYEACMNFLYAVQWGIPFNPEDSSYRF
jgi:hypothetical protein